MTDAFTAEHAAPPHMPPELTPHYMDLLLCVAPKIDDIISSMINTHINSLKLHATARFDPVTATRLLLSEHVIPHKWLDFAKAMQGVGLASNIDVYSRVARVAGLI